MHAVGNTDDALLEKLITAASRSIDRECTGVPDGLNYFMTETVVNEVLEGLLDYTGQSIICYPHKPIITAVTAFSYQENITKTAYPIPSADVASRVEISGPLVKAYPANIYLDEWPSKCRVILSYTGGLGLTVDDLPDDLQELAAILAVRFYREAETGLTDQIGVAELGTMSYTRSWPVRVQEKIQNFKRRVGWRRVA
jgi:hypothetical protein